MPRHPKVNWSDRDRAWKSESGPIGASGRRSTVYFRNLPGDAKGRREAQARLDEYIRDRDGIEEAARVAEASPTCLDVVSRYLTDCRKRVAQDELSADTVKSHAERLRRFLRYEGADGTPMEDRRAATVTDDDVANWLSHLVAAKVGARRRDGLLRTCKACWAWAARPVPGREPKVLVPHDPFVDIEQPTIPARGKPFIDASTFAAILHYGWRRANTWIRIEGDRCSGCVRARKFAGRCRRTHSVRHRCYRAMVLLWRVQYHAGPRPKDLCQAVWQDPTNPAVGWFPNAKVDPNGHRWGLIVVPGKTTRATGRLREIWISPPLRRAIERLRLDPIHPTHIFAHSARTECRTGPWTSLTLAQKFGAWRNEARKERRPDRAHRYRIPADLTLYGCRHTWYSTAVFEAGQTSEQAGAAGGTSGKTVEANYSRARREATFAAAEATNRARRDAAKSRVLTGPEESPG